MTAPSPALRKPKGCILRALSFYGLFLLFVVAVWLVVGYSVAAWQLREERRAWAASGAPMEDLRERFPRAEDSAAARGLCQRARRLGIRLVYEPDWKTTPDEDKLFASARQYVQQFRTATGPLLPPAPADVRAFLEKHHDDLAQTADYLTTTEGITWAIDLDQGSAAPAPSLLGHLRLQYLLLIDAVERQRHGDAAGAQRMLDAARRDNLTLTSRPDLMSMLIGVALATDRNAVLRSMPAAAAEWSAWLAAESFRVSMRRVLQTEAYYALVMARDYRGPMDLDGAAPAAPFSGGLAPSITRALLVPYARLGLSRMSRHVREGGALVMADDICGMNTAAFDEQRKASIPRWNVVARIAALQVAQTWGVAASADLDAELTRLVIEARARQRQNGSWGQVADAPSQVCAGVVWSHQREADGGLAIVARPRPGLDPERKWRFTLPSVVSSR